MVPYATYVAQVTIEDIPQEYRNDSKILTFISAFSSFQEEKKILISRIREEMFLLYEKYSKFWFDETWGYCKDDIELCYIVPNTFEN